MTNYSKDGKEAVTSVNRFDKGITTASRKKDHVFARAVKHFDILSQEDRMLPHRSLETDLINSNLGSAVVGNGIRLVKFLTYGTTQSGTVQFALGTGTNGDGSATDNTPRLYYRDSIPTAQWSGDSGTTGVVNENLFIEYQGIAYAARASGTNSIMQWTLDVVAPLGSSSVASSLSLTFSSIFQGLVHSKDDILYVPYLTTTGAFIARNNAGTWTSTALTLPVAAGNKIDLCESGNDLAIATSSKFFGGRSYVYIWDRDSSLINLSQKVDWGIENIELIEELDGVLIGISTIANSPISFSGSGKILFKYWDGTSNSAKPIPGIPVLECGDRTVSIVGKQKENNRLYFLMSANINGAWHEGLWSLGRNSRGEFALALEYQINNDTQVTSIVLKGFQILGNFLTISYSDNGTYTLKRVDDSAIFSDTCIWESVVFNTGDSSLTKDLIGITVTYEPQPTAGQVLVRYATDANIGANTWTTISTDTTDNSISDAAVNIESSGATLPRSYKEIVFRIESTGATVITGFNFKELITGNKPY